MNCKSILALAACLSFFVADKTTAGELETLAVGAGKAISQAGAPGAAHALSKEIPSPGNPALVNSPGEYKKLAAAFEKGAVPAKADLIGWNAGRFLDRDMPGTPGSFLLAGEDIQPIEGNPGVFTIVPLALYGSPDFYEKLSGDIAAGVAIFIKEQRKIFTGPVFGPVEVTFEMRMPTYNKGFSRYAVRKTADNRILVKHTWKNIMGSGPVEEGVFYAYLTKNVTPRP